MWQKTSTWLSILLLLAAPFILLHLWNTIHTLKIVEGSLPGATTINAIVIGKRQQPIPNTDATINFTRWQSADGQTGESFESLDTWQARTLGSPLQLRKLPNGNTPISNPARTHTLIQIQLLLFSLFLLLAVIALITLAVRIAFHQPQTSSSSVPTLANDSFYARYERLFYRITGKDPP
jgi:hypothetical protein